MVNTQGYGDVKTTEGLGILPRDLRIKRKIRWEAGLQWSVALGYVSGKHFQRHKCYPKPYTLNPIYTNTSSGPWDIAWT